MNFRMIKNILGWILIFEAAFLLIPLLTAIIYKEEVFYAYLISIGICLLFGALLIWQKPKSKTLYSREGFIIVSLSWIVLSLFGALPLFISKETPSYIDALFEIVSGLTTTGSSIIPKVEELSHASLIWRSFTNWIGGMGVLVFVMAFIPLSGGNNMHIMKAESPGPSVSKLVPRVKTTALILYLIYIALTIVEFILLIFGDMNVFEALCSSFSTAGTGGFGVKNDSFNSFSSYSQIVVTVFMFLFSINFASYYLLLLKNFKEAFTTEVRIFIGIVISSIVLLCFNTFSLFPSVGDCIKHVSFTVVSIISTTGFATVDFNLWPSFSRAFLLLLMIIGACAGSTGGGLKVSRLVILFKSILKELGLMIHPKQIKKITVDKQPIESDVVRSTNIYFAIYCSIFAVSTLLLCINDHDLVTSFSAVASTLNNIGPGLEKVGPTQNFAFFAPWEKLLLSFNMLAGRLELFPMLLLFSPVTWKK